jgi:hypothetical protein
MIQFEFRLQNVHQSPGDKVPISRCHFRQMEGCACLKAMIHIIYDILRCENYVHANIAQRQVQDSRRVIEQLFIGKIGRRCRSREQYQRGVGYGVLQTIVNICLQVVLIAEPPAEALRLPAVLIVQTDFAKLPISEQKQLDGCKGLGEICSAASAAEAAVRVALISDASMQARG